MGQIQRVLSTSTPTADGLMSSVDKEKLDTVAVDAGVVSVAGKTGVVSLDKTDIGLGNVDNKSSEVIQSEIPVMRQTILTGESFLDWDNNTVSLLAPNTPLVIVYHDGKVEDLQDGATPWSLSGQPSGIYYLYKQPDGFGMSPVRPSYSHSAYPAFNSPSSYDSNLPLLPAFSGWEESGFSFYSATYQSGFEAWKTADRATGTWKSTTATGSLKIRLPAGLQVGGYSIKSATSANRRDPSAWTVSGEFDGLGTRTLDERSSVTWSGGATKFYSLSQPASFESIVFNFSSSTVVGSGTVLEIDEIQLYPSRYADWVYSIPQQKGFSIGGVEQKRVYLGEAWWDGDFLFDVFPYAVLGTTSRAVNISANTNVDFFHGLGLPSDVCVFSVNLPPGSSSGGFLWATSTRAVIRGDVSGRALLTARRAF